MQTTTRKADGKGKSKEKTSKDDASALTKKAQEDKQKKTSTPRNFVQKSTAADIYVQKKKNAVQTSKTAKKVTGATNTSSNLTPLRDRLKSSSSVSVSSRSKNISSVKSDAKIPKKALPVNVTVNSPIARKKLGKDSANDDSKEVETKNVNTKENKKSSDLESKEVNRQRSKTKTLNEDEVKILTIDAVDNNFEMLNLTRKLAAKPKAFFVGLDEGKKEPINSNKDENEKIEDSTNEDEISYEDDFESYESDFDSYHESHSEKSDEQNSSEQDNQDDEKDVDDNVTSNVSNADDEAANKKDALDDAKEVKDDEKMLDSGNFELRDARSASKPKAMMEFILEDGEVDVKSSLTDEGFQEMSSSSVASVKTNHTDVLDRPLFIDFSVSRENKRKKKLTERLRQRAKDILSMVTLHEMSYSLFEMKPIPYEVYMATFGRTNYTQTAAQTFDDGINVEIQTDSIITEEKWTQHPVDFSNNDIYLKPSRESRKYSNTVEDYLTKFTFLLNTKSDVDIVNKINSDDNYKCNPLRIYFEQKDGVGACEMLPYENYEIKVNNKYFNSKRLGIFLKRVESRLCNVLNVNIGTETADLNKNSKCPFSKGYKLLSMKNLTDEKLKFLKQTKVTNLVLSETNPNLIFTVHDNCPNILANKNVLCLWDVGVAIHDPIKILIAINNVSIARFYGDKTGLFVAGLEDGSIHLWDLSEKPTWRPSVASAEKNTELVEVKAELTQTEKDREWNSKNLHVGFVDSPISHCALHSSSYTTSAGTMLATDASSKITGLILDPKLAHGQDGDRKVLGQVYALQCIGIVSIWSIVQDKLNSPDIGKAYWSKVKLLNRQTISIVEHLTIDRTQATDHSRAGFNLSAAKARVSTRRKEKSLKRQLSRQRSAASDRPRGVASAKNSAAFPGAWDSGVICTDLKVTRLNNNDHYLVSMNCGEVVCCTKSLGAVKVHRFCVTNDLSTVVNLAVTPHSSDLFIAATDTGTLSLCSLTQNRVLLTLDCRNTPPVQDGEKYQVDSKGRFLGSAISSRTAVSLASGLNVGMSVKSIIWCVSNPCCVIAQLASGALVAWDLAYSDIHVKTKTDHAARLVCVSGDSLAVLTPEGEVQLHQVPDASGVQYVQLFSKYVSLL